MKCQSNVISYTKRQYAVCVHWARDGYEGESKKVFSNWIDAFMYFLEEVNKEKQCSYAFDENGRARAGYWFDECLHSETEPPWGMCSFYKEGKYDEDHYEISLICEDHDFIQFDS